MEFKDLLEEVLAKVEDVPRLRINSLKESSCSKPGQNFMSVVCLVHVEGELPDGEPYNKSVFLKRPMQPEDRIHTFSVDDAFYNEVLMYREVLPLLAEGADVTRIACPRHYHAASDVIVLEDLRAQGYGMGNGAAGFDLATTQCIIKALSRFHAASYHTSVVQKTRFFEAIRGLKPLGLFVSGNRQVMESALKRTTKHLETQDDLKTAATSLRTLHGKVTEKMRELRNPKSVPVLVHGDFWFNNLLHRVEENGSEQLEADRIRIIDLQACAFQSPAVDVWLLLYTSISTSLLATNCDNFIRIYASEFVAALKNQKTPLVHIPSEESILEELLPKELYGFLTAMAYLPALYIKPESLSEIGRTNEQEETEGYGNMFFEEKLKDRLTDLTRHCVKQGIFNNLK